MNPTPRSARPFGLALAAGLLLLSAAGAVAQDQPQGPRPPVPTKEDKPPIIMNYLTMVVLGAIAVGANLIPSKRGHQD